MVAAALAASLGAPEWTVHLEDFSVSVKLLHQHFIRIAGLAENAATAGAVVQGVKDLRPPNEIFELRLGLATEALLQPPTSSLAHLQLLTTRHVSLQGIRATPFHLVGLHVAVLGFLLSVCDDGQGSMNCDREP